MIIALAMLQIVFVVLEYPANLMSVSPWAVFLPAMLIAFLVTFSLVTRTTLMLDHWQFTEMFQRR